MALVIEARSAYLAIVKSFHPVEHLALVGVVRHGQLGPTMCPRLWSM